MFENILGFFTGKSSLEVDKDGTPTSRDLQVAAVVLLVEVAHADNKFEGSELDAIVKAMNDEFDLTPEDTGELLEIAQCLREESGRIDEFVEVINANFDESQRQKLLSMVWKVIGADEVVEESEASSAAKIRKRLKLTLEQAMRAQSMS